MIQLNQSDRNKNRNRKERKNTQKNLQYFQIKTKEQF